MNEVGRTYAKSMDENAAKGRAYAPAHIHRGGVERNGVKQMFSLYKVAKECGAGQLLKGMRDSFKEARSIYLPRRDVTRKYQNGENDIENGAQRLGYYVASMGWTLPHYEGMAEKVYCGFIPMSISDDLSCSLWATDAL